MYFNIIFTVFLSFLATNAAAQQRDSPKWNITFYSDKECKKDVSTAQISYNVTCKAIATENGQILSFFPKGPKNFGNEGNANFTVYTKENCPKNSASSSGQLANFNTCNTGSSNYLSYDMYIYELAG